MLYQYLFFLLYALLTLPLREVTIKMSVCLSVCVCDPAVLQELDTPGLPYLAPPHVQQYNVQKAILFSPDDFGKRTCYTFLFCDN